MLRLWKFENLLPILPGVNRSEKDKYTLVINKRVARFITVEILHLLGYRTKQRFENEIRVTRREYDVRGVAKKQ